MISRLRDGLEEPHNQRTLGLVTWGLWWQVFLYLQPGFFPSRPLFEVTRAGGLAVLVGLALGWLWKTHGDLWTFRDIAKSTARD